MFLYMVDNVKKHKFILLWFFKSFTGSVQKIRKLPEFLQVKIFPFLSKKAHCIYGDWMK